MSRFSKKIPEGFSPDDTLCERITSQVKDNQMACASAFALARELQIPESIVGYHLNHLDIPLVKCQIGLFGHSKGAKLIKTLDYVDSRLEAGIRDLVSGGVLSCEMVFRLSGELGISKVDVGSACETLGIKIKHCRFGAF